MKLLKIDWKETLVDYVEGWHCTLSNWRVSDQYNMEQFSDLLDVAIINLRESSQYHELGTESLYVKLQRKLPEMMLASFHRRIFENNPLESVETLRDWIMQEA